MNAQGLTHSLITPTSPPPTAHSSCPQGVTQLLDAIVVMGWEISVGALAPRPEEIGLASPLETKSLSSNPWFSPL